MPVPALYRLPLINLSYLPRWRANDGGRGAWSVVPVLRVHTWHDPLSGFQFLILGFTPLCLFALWIHYLLRKLEMWRVECSVAIICSFFRRDDKVSLLNCQGEFLKCSRSDVEYNNYNTLCSVKTESFEREGSLRVYRRLTTYLCIDMI